MVGGEQAVFDKALPVLQAFGKNIRLCGPVGAGQVVKLINQLLVGIHTSAIAEAAVFGAAFGADPQVVLDLIGTSFGGSTMMTRNLPRFMSRDFSAATPVNLILKDLGLIHDEAKAGGVPLLLGALAEQRFSEARARGMGDEDMAALVKLWEEPAGVSVGTKRLSSACRASPPIYRCSGPSWTCTTASEPPLRQAFPGSRSSSSTPWTGTVCRTS